MQHKSRKQLKPDCNCIRCRFWRVMELPFGSDRREKILEYLETRQDASHPYGMVVNSRYQASLRYDTDLQILIKSGKLTQLPKQRDCGSKRVNVLVLSKYYENFQLK